MTKEHAPRNGDPVLDHPICRAAAEALDRAQVGLILTDRSAAVKFINKAAELHVSGPRFLLQGDRLNATEPRATVRLHRMIRDVTGSATAGDEAVGLSLEGAECDGEFIVAGLSLRPGGGVARRFAMIMVLGEGERASRVREGEGFELTPAETRLLGALVRGQRIGAYAADSGITLSTAKTHLRGLFDKTGERRQADLILRALSDPMLRAKWSE